MKFVIISISLFFSISYVYSQQNNTVSPSVIGSTYTHIKELPAFRGYKEFIGTMLQPINANYATSIVAKGNYNVLILDTCIITGKSVRYKILDTVVIGSVPKNQIIVTSDCRVKRHDDNNIIAIAMLDDKEYHKNVIKAWRINRSKHRIERIGVKDIDCLNEGYGI